MKTSPTKPELSFIIPCLNEQATVPGLLRSLRQSYPDAQILLVDDGSTPPVTACTGVQIIRHPQPLGNGAAIKAGVREADGKLLVFMDADGQHDPNDIQGLLDKIDQGFDMVVGARRQSSHAGWHRRWANHFFNRLASYMVGKPIEDLTSGFRAARAEVFRKFLYLLPNGFSYPATSTIAFFRCGYAVAYLPISALQRHGRSKIRLFHDGTKFLLIILRIGTLFSPMRFFLPLSGLLFLTATFYHSYTYINTGRFTNMGIVIYLSSLITFMFGILSEQISALHYRFSEDRRRHTDYTPILTTRSIAEHPEHQD
ncbi:MAG TPA: glycosyltransferase family 2 protein [Gammaproteobacteria bacterium]|nr:glycosyltransferase family 2 protein [Gammaproteobacteria bacterium]